MKVNSDKGIMSWGKAWQCLSREA